eukprot:GDKJ01049162.1.p1 GENE.GDKJ01049162.1~~GDKJ01049162.1.p1  ORF type:complete len:266 (-),score=29.46 GDKJ01049162.1:567-1364(-)
MKSLFCLTLVFFILCESKCSAQRDSLPLNFEIWKCEKKCQDSRNYNACMLNCVLQRSAPSERVYNSWECGRMCSAHVSRVFPFIARMSEKKRCMDICKRIYRNGSNGTDPHDSSRHDHAFIRPSRPSRRLQDSSTSPNLNDKEVKSKSMKEVITEMKAQRKKSCEEMCKVMITEVKRESNQNDNAKLKKISTCHVSCQDDFRRFVQRFSVLHADFFKNNTKREDNSQTTEQIHVIESSTEKDLPAIDDDATPTSKISKQVNNDDL